MSSHRVRASAIGLAVAVGGFAPAVLAAPPVEAAAKSWKTRVVEYGDGPVSFKSGRRMKVVFDGRRGDRVSLRGSVTLPRPDATVKACQQAKLVRSGRSLGAPDVSSFWRLPANGRYAFKVRNCEGTGAAKLQLTKLRVRTVGIGGSKRFVKERGFQYAVQVRTPLSGAAMVRIAAIRGSRVASGIVTMGRRAREDFYGNETVELNPASVPNLLLEAGQPLRYLHPRFNENYRGETGYAADPDRLLKPGSRVRVLPRRSVKVLVRRPVTHAAPVEVGGAGLSVTAGPRPKELHTAKLTNGSERWVRLAVDVDGQLQEELSGGAGTTVAAYVAGPGGEQVPAPRNDLVRLPAGTSELRVLAQTRDAQRRGVTVRVLPVRELPAMPTDGTKVEFATEKPGEWVLAPVTLDPARSYRAEASDVTIPATSEWGAHVASAQVRPLCRDGFCLPTIASLNDTHRIDEGLRAVDRGTGPWYALFRPGVGVSGSIRLSLTPAG